MTIESLLDKFKNTHNDTVLSRDVVLTVKITFIPEDPFTKYIILEDDTGSLEAVPITRKIFESLKLLQNDKLVRLKGRLDKTGFGNIAYAIEEILD